MSESGEEDPWTGLDSDQEVDEDFEKDQVSDNDGDNDLDMDEDELDQELALPSLLSNISMAEKKKLLEFKKTHTEFEWEEEMLKRQDAFSRQMDFERLKRLSTGATDVSKAAKPARGKKIIPEPKKAPAKKPAKKGRGKKAVLSDEDEEGEIVEEAEEEEEEEDFKPKRGSKRKIEKEEVEENEELFDSDEEEAISNRKVTQHDESDEEEEDRQTSKRSKVLKKKGSASSSRRTSARQKAAAAKKYEDSDDFESGAEDDFAPSDDDDDEESNNDMDIDRDEDLGYGNNENSHDYNLKSIKDSHRIKINKEGLPMMDKASSSTTNDNEFIKIQEDLKKQEYLLLNREEQDQQYATFDDYLKIFLRRDMITKILHEPFLEKLIKGCYVRFLLRGEHKIYRFCEIIGIEKTNTMYPITTGDGKVIKTNIRLILNSAGVLKENVKMDLVSNHTFTTEELEFHLQGMKRHLKTILTKGDIKEIRYRQKELREYQYTNEDINQMIHNKVGLNKVYTTDFSTAMSLLLKKKETAIQQKDYDLLEQLTKEIDKLEQVTQKQKQIVEKNYSKQIELNRRLKENNVRRDMVAGMKKRQEEEDARAKGLLSNDITDPFIRRQTRPKNLWNTTEKLNEIKTLTNEAKKVEGSSDLKPSMALLTNSKLTKLRDDDAWNIAVGLSLDEIRNRIKQRLGQDPYEYAQLSLEQKYLQRVCSHLPPKLSKEREVLRGNNKSIADYIAEMAT